MKKATIFIPFVVLLLAMLSACQQIENETNVPQSSSDLDLQYTAEEIVEKVFLFSGCNTSIEVEHLNEDDKDKRLSAYVENAYGLSSGEWEDIAVIRATGASAFEIAILRMGNDNDVLNAVNHLEKYCSNREGDFAGYAPAQALLVSHAIIERQGFYVGLFICESADAVAEAFLRIIETGEIPEIVSTEEPATERERFGIEVLLDNLLSICQDEIDSMDGVSIESDFDSVAELAKNRYDIADDQLEMGFIVTAEDPDRYAFELVVLHIRDSADGNQIIENLTYYRKSRKRDFRELGLIDQQMIAGDGWAVREGDYVALLICQERETMVEAFRKAARECESKDMSGEPVFTEVNWEEPEGEIDPHYPSRIKFIQPKKDDMSVYDTTAIVNAWNKHDPTALSNYDQQIFDKAKSVLEEIIQDNMDDYDKEVAIYDWIIQNVDYDWTHTDIMADTSKESYTPFGGLVNCKAICLGYATTFQLMMELEGIKCVTIVGAAQESTEDHSWNMVQLNGNWYCVDITWDAEFWRSGMMNGKEWRFFNVTSDYMARTNHQWDYTDTPEATATDHGRN